MSELYQYIAEWANDIWGNRNLQMGQDDFNAPEAYRNDTNLTDHRDVNGG
jgi:hypothetical protein